MASRCSCGRIGSRSASRTGRGGGGSDVVGENRFGMHQVADLETQNPAARAAAEAAASEAAAELEMQ